MAFFGLIKTTPPPERVEPALVKPQSGVEQARPMVSSFARDPYGGHPASGLTPAALAMILRSAIVASPRLYLELAEDMEERFTQYGSTLSTRKRAVARMEISVEPAGDQRADLDEAALVRGIIEGAPFRGALIDLLDALGKSYSCVEMIWDTASKPWRPVKFKHRDPRFFDFDRNDPDRLLLLTDTGAEDLWPNCWLVHRAKAKSGLTIRGGLARQAAWLFIFQSFNTKDWAIFAEAFGQPLRVGKFDPGALEADKLKLLEAVHSIGADYAAIIPQAMAIEFIKAEITGSTDLYERRADWIDRQVSKLVLGQTGTTDSSEGSGYAQAKVHDGVRDDIADADAEQLAATINEQLVPALVGLNFPQRSRKGFPVVHIGRPDEEDVGAWVDHVSKLIPIGLEVSLKEAQEKIGVTPPSKGEVLLGSKAAPAPQPANDRPQAKIEQDGQRVASAQQLPHDAVQAAIEDALGAGGWEPLVGPLAEDVRTRLMAASTPDEALQALADAFAQFDAGELAELLARSMFAARLAGELDEGI